MANRSNKPKGTPCPADLSAAVRALLASMPESHAVARLGLARATVVRLAAGLSVHETTIAQARARLAEPVPTNQLSLLAV